jgi:hypothetical protein
MRRTIVGLMVSALVAGVIAGPAAAGKTAKVPATMFLHGRGPVAEAYINETWIDSIWMTMDTTEPTNAEPSSMFVTNYFRGPNTDCDGNGLLPVWRGDFSGKFKGDIKVTLHTLATPAAELTVSLYPDPTGTCSSAGTPATAASEAPQPVATTLIDVAPGQAVTEVLFENVKLKAAAGLALQLSVPTQTTPGQVRVFFDSPDFASNIEFIK